MFEHESFMILSPCCDEVFSTEIFGSIFQGSTWVTWHHPQWTNAAIRHGNSAMNQRIDQVKQHRTTMSMPLGRLHRLRESSNRHGGDSRVFGVWRVNCRLSRRRSDSKNTQALLSVEGKTLQILPATTLWRWQWAFGWCQAFAVHEFAACTSAVLVRFRASTRTTNSGM